MEYLLDKFKCFDQFDDVVYFDCIIKPDFRLVDKKIQGNLTNQVGKVIDDHSLYLVYDENKYNLLLNTDRLSIHYLADKKRFKVSFKRGIFTEKFFVSKEVAVHRNIVKKTIELVLEKLNERHRVICDAF